MRQIARREKRQITKKEKYRICAITRIMILKVRERREKRRKEIENECVRVREKACANVRACVYSCAFVMGRER